MADTDAPCLRESTIQAARKSGNHCFSGLFEETAAYRSVVVKCNVAAWRPSKASCARNVACSAPSGSSTIPRVRPSINRWSTGREMVAKTFPPRRSVTSTSMIIWVLKTSSRGRPWQSVWNVTVCSSQFGSPPRISTIRSFPNSSRSVSWRSTLQVVSSSRPWWVLSPWSCLLFLTHV